MIQWDSNQICLISKIHAFLITRNKARPINRAKVPGSKLQTQSRQNRPGLYQKTIEQFTESLGRLENYAGASQTETMLHDTTELIEGGTATTTGRATRHWADITITDVLRAQAHC